MSLYQWENTASHHKKVKKTGVVVLHPAGETLDVQIERLLRPQAVLSANPFSVFREEKLHNNNEEEDDEGKKKPKPTAADDDDDDEDGEVEMIEEDEEEEEGEQPKRRRPMMPMVTPETVETLHKKFHFDSLLPTQAQCYKGIFLRRDVILHSHTGSGKTIAYALPIIERYLLFREREEKPDDVHKQPGPFLLVFVFSVDLATQTMEVLRKLYPMLRIEVAHSGSSTNSSSKSSEETPAVSEADKAKWAAAHILIGTVPALDNAIRGRAAILEAQADEAKEAAAAPPVAGMKRKRTEEKKTSAKATPRTNHHPSTPADGESASGLVSATNVQAVVVDEVDTTLGPRFSSIGRRMKRLLQHIRRSNGSLAPGLLTDYRAHHYVLCGATIPNWVLKAGFLGVKKYYYRLVNPGTSKLASGLQCYEILCNAANRVKTITELLIKNHQQQQKKKVSGNHNSLGRVVVFGTNKQVEQIEASLQATSSSSSASSSPSVYVLSARRDEKLRIAAMQKFNQGNDPSAVLLCTDLAARGLDFTDVHTVMMASLPAGPMAVETFVHRAGRTARVGSEGKCVVLWCGSTNLTSTGATEERDSVERIQAGAHVVLKDFMSTIGGGSADEQQQTTPKKGGKAAAKGTAAAGKAITVLELVVRRPFHSSPDPNAAPLPTAEEVLMRELQKDAEAVKLVEVVTSAASSTDAVQFSVPTANLHTVKKLLWKYNLKEISRQ